MKKTMLVLCMAILLVFAMAVPVSAGTYGDLTYEITDGEVTITDCSGSATGKMIIPSEIEGYPVTYIGNYAFYSCSSLTSVTIPNSVTEIGSGAFLDCNSLTSVTIPNSVTEIGDRAFFYCSCLTSVTIPNSVTSIGNQAFDSCDKLTEIVVSSGNPAYSNDASGVLFNKEKTVLIQYPDGKKETSYVIPNSVTSIGYSAFEYCDSLTSVTIPNSVTSIGDYAFRYCDSLTSVTIPNSVTSIGDYAFYYCNSLTSVTIRNSVTEIGFGAFSGCPSLTLYGYSGSTTEEYAEEHGIPFSLITKTEPANYSFQVVDQNTGKGISGASFTYDGNTVKTDSSGMVRLTLPTNQIGELVVDGGDGYEVYRTNNLWISPNSVNGISLKSSSGISVPDIEAGGDTLTGPSVHMKNTDFSLFQFDMGLKIKISDMVKIYYNEKEKTVEVLIGFNDDVIPGSDKWMKDSKAVRDLYRCTQMGNYSGANAAQRSLIKDLNSRKAEAAFSGDATIAGFGTYDLTTDSWRELGVTVTLKAKVTQANPLPVFPAAYSTGSISGEIEGSAKLVSASNPYLQTSMSLDVKPSIGLGIGVSNLLCLEGGLSGSMKGTITSSQKTNPALADILTVDASLSYYIKAVAFLYQEEFTQKIASARLYPRSKSRSFARLLPGENSGNEEMELMPRDYLEDESGSISLSSASAEDLWKENVFPYSDVQFLSLGGGKRLLVWVEDNASRSSSNRTELRYSVYNGSSWSAEKAVYDDGTADFSPKLVSDGENTMLIWQNAVSVFNEDSVTLDEMKSSMSLSASVFNGTSFETPVTLDGSGLAQNYLSVDAENGNFVVAWIENSENDLDFASGTNALYLKEYRDENWQETEITDGSVGILQDLAVSYDNDTLVVAFSADTDDNTETGETEVYISNGDKKILSETPGSNGDLQFLNGTLYWNAEGVLTYWNETEGLVSSGVSVGEDLTCVDKNGTVAAFWKTSDGFCNELYCSEQTEGEWSSAAAVTDYDMFIRYFAPIEENGSILIAAEALTVDETKIGDTAPLGQANLYVTGAEQAFDMQVDPNLCYDAESCAPGNTMYLYTTVTNNSMKTVSELSYALSDQTTGTLRINLAPGESAEIAVPYVISETLLPHQVTLTVTAPGMEEKDLSDNTASCEIGLADIKVTYTEISDDGTIQCGLTNQGYSMAMGVCVSLYEDNDETLLATEYIGTVRVGGYKYCTFEIDRDKLQFSDENEVKHFLVKAETSSVENTLYNNDATADYYPVHVSDVTISHQCLEIALGQSFKLSATVLPANALNQSVVWLSDNTDVVTVDEKGTVTAVSPGTAYVSVSSQDGNISKVCAVTVTENEYIPVTEVTLEPAELTLDKGESAVLNVGFLPENASCTELLWESDHPEIVSVSDKGEITALKGGSAVITATSRDSGKSASCVVTVEKVFSEAKSIYLDYEYITMDEGDSKRLTARIFSDSTAADLEFDETIVWTSENPEIATVNDGLVTAVSAGTTTITATTSKTGFKDECTVEIEKKGEYVYDGFLIFKITDGIATVKSCDSEAEGEIVIPSEIDGYPVESISKEAFSDCWDITSIVIPDSITRIENRAFAYCGGLTQINIPESVTSIEERLFSGCYNLADVSLPDGLISIGDSAFLDCSSLSGVTIPESVNTIGDYAFCESGLIDIVIPAGVTSIGDFVFDDCRTLEEIRVAEDNPSYSSDESGVLFNKDKTELLKYPEGNSSDSYIIPGSVTNIRNLAFGGCDALTDVTFSESVTDIGEYAFQYCYGLASITLPESIVSVGEGAFSGCYDMVSATILNPNMEFGVGAFSTYSSLTLCGYSGSTTETYAIEYDLPFVALDGDSVVGVSLNKAELELYVGDDELLVATVLPGNAVNKAVTWDSSDSSIATVENGKVTALKAGKATITVTTEDGNKTASCTVTVKEKTPDIIAVTGVSLNKSALDLKVGDSATLTATVLPANATNKSVTWKSDNTAVATVENGKVTALKAGTATITATTVDGNKTASCKVTVSPSVIAVTGVSLDKSSLDLKVGESASLTATVSPTNATNKSVTWKSDNTAVATVENGKVTALKAGTATIIVTTVDGNKTASCKVTVRNEVPVFSDVPNNAWFAPYVYDLAGQGIISGMTATTFAPDGLITRAQFAKILAAASGEDLSSCAGKTSFNDVPASAWYASYVQWAYEKGVVSGMGGGRFAPNDSITREQMAAMLCRYAAHKKITLPKTNTRLTFKDDASISGWAKENVYAMQQADIIHGYTEGGGVIFNPKGNAKRSEAATMVSFFLKLK